MTILLEQEYANTSRVVAEEPDVVARAGTLRSTLRERSRETDRLARLPESILADLEEARLFEITTPRLYGGRKISSALARGNSAAPFRTFRTCASLGKSGPTRRTMNGEIERPRLQIRVGVKWQRSSRLIFIRASCVASAMLLRPVFWPARSQPFGS